MTPIKLGQLFFDYLIERKIEAVFNCISIPLITIYEPRRQCVVFRNDVCWISTYRRYDDDTMAARLLHSIKIEYSDPKFSFDWVFDVLRLLDGRDYED